MANICLNMIVKDESRVICRCLDSIVHLIDYWVISDTGSSDGTQQIIRDYFSEKNIPGELHEHAWHDFSHNRNLALKVAQQAGKADYLLIIDADDYLEAPSNFLFDNLKADAYLLNIKRGSVNYAFPKLLKASLPWLWRGVLHEFVECPTAEPSALYPGNYCFYSTSEGSRGTDPEKFKKDIALLKKGLEQEPNNARYMFYLAQSYRDDGDYQQAMKHYQKRAAMGGWDEEVFYSLLEEARCKQKLTHPIPTVLDSYLKAHHYRPTRLESLCDALAFCRQHQLFHIGYQLGSVVYKIEMPKDILFVDQSVYQWRFADELSVAAIYAGYKVQAAAMIKKLLSSKDLPDSERARLESNLSYT